MMRERLTWVGPVIAAVALFVLAGGVGRSAEGDRQSPPSYMDTYTGADAEKVGSAVCTACHGDVVPDSATSHIAILDKDEKSPYYGFGCEGCHGPGSKHNGDIHGILNPAKMTAEDVTNLCSTCHAKLGLFDKDAWLVSKHFLDGGLGCLSCHSGHSVNDKFLVKDKIVDVCFACHSAIRDDFEAGKHNGADPATMTCVTCHNPHNVGRSAQAPENN